MVNGDLYIFGGCTAPGQLASNDMHIIRLSRPDEGSPQYKCVPALGRDGEQHGGPQARASHSSCSIGERILIFGGTSEVNTPNPIVEGSCRVWVFDTRLSQWSPVDAEFGPPPRSGHQAVQYQDSLMILHGGIGTDLKELTDTWAFNIQSGTWTQLPDLPTTTPQSSKAPNNLAQANGSLYIITHSSDLTATIHTLDMKAAGPSEWSTLEVPITFPSPGPRPRQGAGLLTLHTGQGRTYLLYIFGASAGEDSTAKNDSTAKLWSGIWALQLPASGGAHAKDVARESVGLDSRQSEWAEVEIVPSEQSDSMEGKAHPGPRAYFGCDIIPSNQTVVLWGGMEPDGKYTGDGWVINFSSPAIKGMLKKIPGVGRFVKDDS